MSASVECPTCGRVVSLLEGTPEHGTLSSHFAFPGFEQPPSAVCPAVWGEFNNLRPITEEEAESVRLLENSFRGLT